MIKKLTNEKERQSIKSFRKFQKKQFKDLSQQEKDELLEIIAKKLNLIK